MYLRLRFNYDGTKDTYSHGITAVPSLVPRLEAGLSGTYTANTHSLSLVRFDVKSSLIGLIRFYEAEHENTLYQVITNFKPKKC